MTTYPPPPPIAVPAAPSALPPSIAGAAPAGAAPAVVAVPAAPPAAPPAVVPVVAVVAAPAVPVGPPGTAAPGTAAPPERAPERRSKPRLEPELLDWLQANGYSGKSAAVAASLMRRVRGWLPGWEALDGPRLWEAGVAAITEAEDGPATASAWRTFVRYRTGYVAPDRRRVSPGQMPTPTLLSVVAGYLGSGPAPQVEDRLRALLSADWGTVGVGDLGALSAVQSALGGLGPGVLLLRARTGAGLVLLPANLCAACAAWGAGWEAGGPWPTAGPVLPRAPGEAEPMPRRRLLRWLADGAE